MAWGALAADVASLVIPGLTGGGKIVRFVSNSEEILDTANYADDIFDGTKQFFGSKGHGILRHNDYDPIQDTVTGVQKLKNQSLKNWNSKLRPDAVDLENRIIYELKPYNKRSFKRAVNQVNNYAKTLGGEWTIVIDMYTS